jgi:dehydrogenase/reductase SDR family protein 7
MSFLEFCIVLLLLWFVIFVVFLFILDGDLSLIFNVKFGKKIRKLQHNIKNYQNNCYVYGLSHLIFLDNLKGEVIWITGASTGIGAGCAVQAAKIGAKLVLTARNENLLKQVKQKCLGNGYNPYYLGTKII